VNRRERVRTSVRELFGAAAGRYGEGNPLLVLERPETAAALPALAGRDVLDLGAGQGHYAALARRGGARLAIALDLTPEMLATAPEPSVVADAQRLPLRDASIDVVVAALALSYAADRAAVVAEAARVLRPGGWLVVTDLHPVASERGWSRSFVGRLGECLVVIAEPPTLAELAGDLARAGLELESVREPAIDARLEPEFSRAGRKDYRALRGTPLLLVVRARKRGR
jgi:malonyl-CoA O-methyltransferase